MKKVLILINSGQLFFLHRKNYAHFLKQKGFQVTVLVPQDSYFQKIQEEGFELIPFQINRKTLNPFMRLVEVWNLSKIYKKIKPDIIHHFGLVCIVIGSFASYLAKQEKVLNTFSGLGYLFIGKNFFKKSIRYFLSLLLRFLFRKLKVFCFTENIDDKKTLLEYKIISEEKILVLPGIGIDLNKFPYTPKEENGCKVLLAARMLYDKGIYEFQEAAKILKAKYPSVEFLLAGKVDPENPSHIPESVLKIWNQEGHINWLGELTDMLSSYQKVDIVCLPSYREGLPVSLLEASAVGRVVVTTDTVGCRDIIKDKNGLLVPVKNIPKLAEALEILIQNPELRKQMGQKAHEVVKKYFSQEIVFSILYKVIETEFLDSEIMYKNQT